MSNISKPLILITNDDGITSPGIAYLVKQMLRIGEVVVVAPDKPQSGMGHAITIGHPLRLNKVDIFDGVEAYKCSGTPADCVKLAKHHVLHDRKPDLVVSGINHGSNSSVNVIYSGTMSAAIEAAMEGLPSIGFSLCDYAEDADFSHCFEFVFDIAQKVVEKPLEKGVALNVNFPAKSQEPLKGIKVCRQAHAKWDEEFDEREDPYTKKYYWMQGEFKNLDTEKDTDIEALDNNYVSIVPCKYDLTDYNALEEAKSLF